MSAMTDHIRSCSACRKGKECSEAERLIGQMDSEKVMKAVGGRKWIHAR